MTATNIDLEHEHNLSGAGSVAARNFQKLANLVIDTGGESVGLRFGFGTVGFPGGSPLSNTVTILHGLGRAPISVLLTSVNVNVALALQTSSTVNFTVRGRTIDGTSPVAPSNINYCWLVLG